ncbi:hypothetical protein BK011_09975 [Tenericutes bacterium MZ-XQ]|jgi:hypothetical protein|nr:hypothetical protein BK011_09975 [Tenericutes bacterium MZ-XQ]
MKEFIKAVDDLPVIIKLILALPGIDSFAWGIYRIVKGLDRNDTVQIIVGIIWLLAGWAVLWIIDIITILMYKRPTVFA